MAGRCIHLCTNEKSNQEFKGQYLKNTGVITYKYLIVLYMDVRYKQQQFWLSYIRKNIIKQFYNFYTAENLAKDTIPEITKNCQDFSYTKN